VLRGRAFNSADLDHDAVSSQKLCDLFLAAGNTASKIAPDLTLHAVVSKTAARTFWKKQDPVSKTFRWNDAQVMVGMVDDVKEYGIRAKTMPQAYFPHTVELPYNSSRYLTLRTAIAPSVALSEVRGTVQALDRGLAILRPRTMEEVIGKDTQDARVQTLL
jgi:hypothetical protein